MIAGSVLTPVFLTTIVHLFGSTSMSGGDEPCATRAGCVDCATATSKQNRLRLSMNSLSLRLDLIVITTSKVETITGSLPPYDQQLVFQKPQCWLCPLCLWRGRHQPLLAPRPSYP